MNLIKKTVFYHSPREGKLKSGMVVKTCKFRSVIDKDKTFVRLELDNGDFVARSKCYFECPVVV
ncbi:hypothetical protein LCGC14_2107950 [marine sediment metagenome]|uniref:Uncharacterized protein n=1 Tax=marine sediment metagenome TaxID=412755 RepID=A0A0F9H483_9ZZZZ